MIRRKPVQRTMTHRPGAHITDVFSGCVKRLQPVKGGSCLMLEAVIRGGTVVDGTGRPGFKADVGIKDGKIASIGDLSMAEAQLVVDATGCVVCPGFIDMHSHSDLSVMAHRNASSSLCQGITTELVGSCGWSMAPVKEETRKSVLQGLISTLVNREAFESLDWSWHSFGEFLDSLEKGGLGVNVAPLVGQSLIRAHVVGTENRPATSGEIQAMKALVADAMESGAWGMSTGRSYRPGGFAPTSEIMCLAQVVARYDGIYTTHIKSEGDDIFSAVNEAIEICRKAEVRTEISHHKAVGVANFGKVNRTLEMIADARKEGLPISIDLYPYEFSQATSLVRMVPPEVLEEAKKALGLTSGSSIFPTSEEIERMLKDPGFVSRVKENPQLMAALARMGKYVILRAPSFPQFEGRVLDEISREENRSVPDVVLDLAVADGLGVWAAWPISMKDVHTVVRASFASIGTDAFALDHPISPTPVHPRHYGTFPRVIGRFVREGVLSLEEAIRKCTFLPARTLGLPDRGCIQQGYWADLVVFDPESIADRATAREPYLYPEGIKHVFVNGKLAFDGGEVKKAFAGKVLRRR